MTKSIPSHAGGSAESLSPHVAKQSIAAADRLPGMRTLCSLERGWSGLLLRRYDEPQEAEFETSPTPDQLIVMVRSGRCAIESRAASGWRSARYCAGDLGMTAPGEGARLRFHGPSRHTTLQLHVPAGLIASAADDVGGVAPRLDVLCRRHDATAAMLTSLERGLEVGAPPLFAETAIHYLLMQMVLDVDTLLAPRESGSLGCEKRLDDYMCANLSKQITLADMAAEVGLSVFQLIRLCHARWQMAPAARLCSLRLERGRDLLRTTDLPVTAVAMDCGYENPSHFATAFRRRFGMPPSRCRGD